MKSIADTLAEQRKQPLFRRVMRAMFMPEIRLSFQTTGMTHRAFLSVIAMMFIQSGLLPYNHPARSMASIGDIGLREIIGEAWFNLRTRKVMDVQQYGLFFSIFLLFAMAIMIGIMLFAKLVTGTAQAAMTSGLFTSPDPENDLGLWIIDELIGKDMAAGGPLGNLFSVYSYGVLVIASFIVAWSILSIVVDTAHTGKFFGGRHNPVWWPIRLVFALGILIPLGTGFNAGQYMVVQIAKWGSNFASSAWTAYLSGDALGDKMLVVPPRASINYEDFMGIATILVCVNANNNYELELAGGNAGVAQASAGWIPEIPTPITDDPAVTTITWANDNGGSCGSIELQTPQASASYSGSPTSGGIMQVEFPTDMMSSVYTEYANAYLNIIVPAAQDMAVVVAGSLSPIMPSYGVVPSGAGYLLDAMLALESAEAQLQDVLDNLTPAVNDAFKQAALEQLGEKGWASAPLMYHYIAGANDKMQQESSPKAGVRTEMNFPDGDRGQQMDIARSHLQEVASKEAAQSPGIARRLGGFFMGVGKALTAPVRMAAKAVSDTVGAVMKVVNQLQGWAKGMADAAKKDGFGAILNGAGEKFMEMISLYPNVEDLHPLAAMSALGAKIINGWAALVAASALVAAGLSFISVGTMGSIFANIWVVLSFLLSPALLAAVILHVVVPMLPFIRFVFAISGWIIAIVEGVVMVPVIAIGHLRTDGEGLIGPMLQSTYIMFLQLLLRPILILIGLVISINIVDITTQYVNGLFFPMIQTLPHGNFDFLAVLVRKISLIALYSALMYALINSSFKIMDLLPEAVVKYLGSGAQGGMQDREGDNISGAVVAGSVIARGMPQGFKGIKDKDSAAKSKGKGGKADNAATDDSGSGDGDK